MLTIVGFSRVPVFEDDRQNLVSILYIKDLAFVDPDDKVPLRSHCQFYQNHCYFVFEDTKLDIMFRQFKEGLYPLIVKHVIPWRGALNHLLKLILSMKNSNKYWCHFKTEVRIDFGRNVNLRKKK